MTVALTRDFRFALYRTVCTKIHRRAFHVDGVCGFTIAFSAGRTERRKTDSCVYISFIRIFSTSFLIDGRRRDKQTDSCVYKIHFVWFVPPPSINQKQNNMAEACFHIKDILGGEIDYASRKPIVFMANIENLHWNLIRVVHESHLRYPTSEVQVFEPMGCVCPLVLNIVFPT